jgi:hypothetical protein
VLVRGGIIADEVGYGKTAITLGIFPSFFLISFFKQTKKILLVEFHEILIVPPK